LGLKAGPLSQWLYAGIMNAGLTRALETRHVKAALSAMTVKTDARTRVHCPVDANGLVPASSLQIGWFAEVRALLVARQTLARQTGSMSN